MCFSIDIVLPQLLTAEDDTGNFIPIAIANYTIIYLASPSLLH